MRRLVLLLVALPTLALADVLSGTPAPRPMSVVAPAAKPVAVGAPARRASKLSLAAPPATAAADPGECRMSCAQTYYICNAAGSDVDCSGAWSRCVATCLSPSLDPGLSAGP